jgi:hypothetical protein
MIFNWKAQAQLSISSAIIVNKMQWWFALTPEKVHHNNYVAPQTEQSYGNLTKATVASLNLPLFASVYVFISELKNQI